MPTNTFVQIRKIRVRQKIIIRIKKIVLTINKISLEYEKEFLLCYDERDSTHERS